MWTAPFGCPVLPEVYISIAGSSGATTFDGDASSAAASPTKPVSESTLTISTARSLSAIAWSSSDRYSSPTNTTLASLCSIVKAICETPARTLTGAMTKPPYIEARNSVAASRPLLIMRAILSPRLRPVRAKRALSARDRCARSSNVSERRVSGLMRNVSFGFRAAMRSIRSANWSLTRSLKFSDVTSLSPLGWQSTTDPKPHSSSADCKFHAETVYFKSDFCPVQNSDKATED